MRESVKERKVQKRHDEDFKRQAVELVIHSGRTQAQIADACSRKTAPIVEYFYISVFHFVAQLRKN
jgi:hypothetical protein